ncbi:MAG TPA: hypothetical protein VHU92_04315 [Streptosporangiaceae bacterium]|jgi:hypothetical protein|nr:hypothetical protein [Streptosporangiaceae bacterium]
MSSPDPSSPAITARGSRWRFVITPRWLAWHAFTVVAVWGMLWLGDWQFHRAESGNALSWAYTFEWPIFAVFGIVFWVKTIIDEGKPKQADDAEAASADGSEAEAATAGLPARRHVAGGQAGDEAEGASDTELDEYNAYLAKLHKQVQGHGKWHGLR